MKKIFTFAALLCAAVTMNAEITVMTCAEAKAAALAGQTDSASVTGYVTKDYSGISRGQQRFSMDDAKGTVETFHCYFANMPEGEAALNVGDKVTVKGVLQNYNGTAQFKNGDVVAIVERIHIDIDTIESSVCEVIEEGEALNSGEKTTDYFIVEGVVSSIKSEMNQYNQESFWMVCDVNNKELQAYNAVMKDGEDAKIGDKVKVIGRIENFNGTIELSTASAEVLEKGHVKIDTISVSVAQAVNLALALPNGASSNDLYAITGYVDSIAIEYNEKYGNISFFMTDDMENPTYEFEAYRVKVYDWQAARIVVGAQVTVTAPLKHYYKAAEGEKLEINLAETAEGGTVEFVGFEGINNVRDNEQTIKRIENGQVVIIRNNVKYNALGVEVK